MDNPFGASTAAALPSEGHSSVLSRCSGQRKLYFYFEIIVLKNAQVEAIKLWESQTNVANKESPTRNQAKIGSRSKNLDTSLWWSDTSVQGKHHKK